MPEKKINEFGINMVCYNLDNKYELGDIIDMFVEWAESKSLMVGGSVYPIVIDGAETAESVTVRDN